MYATKEDATFFECTWDRSCDGYSHVNPGDIVELQLTYGVKDPRIRTFGKWRMWTFSSREVKL